MYVGFPGYLQIPWKFVQFIQSFREATKQCEGFKNHQKVFLDFRKLLRATFKLQISLENLKGFHNLVKPFATFKNKIYYYQATKAVPGLPKELQI